MKIRDFFTEVKLEPGEASEFPLDFVNPLSTASREKVALSENQNEIRSFNPGGDTVWIQTFPVGSSADTSDEVVSQVNKKIDNLLFDLVAYVGKENELSYHSYTSDGFDLLKNDYSKITRCLIFGTYDDVLSKIEDSKFTKIGISSEKRILVVGKRRYGNFIIGFSDDDNFVLPVRQAAEAWKDPVGGGYYGWADIGMGILSANGLVISVRI